LDEADVFITQFINEVNHLGTSCASLLQWASERSSQSPYDGPGTRAIYLLYAFDSIVDAAPIADFSALRDYALSLAHILNRQQSKILDGIFNFSIAEDRIFRARELAHIPGITLQWNDVNRSWKMGVQNSKRVVQYLSACSLLAECLQLAAVADRKALEAQILLPPKSSKRKKQQVFSME
jgi:hypothetical protein